MTDFQLETKELTRIFGGLRAVDRVNFKIEKGELRCLIGPNGAGKTTLFNLLMGDIKPTSGRVIFEGEDITGLNTHQIARRGVSRKFQVPQVYETLTLRENLSIPTQFAVYEKKLGIFAKRSENVEHKVDNILRRTNLMERQHDLASNLSHGEKQWLEIGLALATEPKLLLLDEPTAGMTAEESRRTGDLIREINKEASIILVEHDISFVREVARRVTVMHNGRIFAEGTIREIEADERVRDIYLGRSIVR